MSTSEPLRGPFETAHRIRCADRLNPATDKPMDDVGERFATRWSANCAYARRRKVTSSRVEVTSYRGGRLRPLMGRMSWQSARHRAAAYSLLRLLRTSTDDATASDSISRSWL
jgi:hypothetical protein